MLVCIPLFVAYGLRLVSFVLHRKFLIKVIHTLDRCTLSNTSIDFLSTSTVGMSNEFNGWTYQCLNHRSVGGGHIFWQISLSHHI